jgi:stage II sporulation protein P
MSWEKKCLCVGAAALILAVGVRLVAGGVIHSAAKALASTEALSLIFFLETGKVVRPGVPEPIPEKEPEQTEPAPETQPQEEKAPVTFEEKDAELVEVNSICGYETAVEAWISQPLSLKLQGEKPTVLIVHSHGTESYVNQEGYEESGDHRTKNKNYNVVSVGAELKKVLEAGGISVIHDTTMHDDPSYNAAYNQSRKSVQQYLKEYPSISMVLDIHRDAVANKNGEQTAVTVKADGKKIAQLMLVVGTDVRLRHPLWPENMALAVKLHALLEKNVPGICRPISFRKQRFNQDLSPGALLIEVGAAGNTRQEALAAAKVLGETIVQLG